ncbi:hypothetical protein LUZ60_016962 [Juncus effusus]|nr:hypothetical protein LUZ60_016962 [Juncus effusus]
MRVLGWLLVGARGENREVDESINTELNKPTPQNPFLFFESTIKIKALFLCFTITQSQYCMAANSKGRVIAGTFGKRFVNQILSPTPLVPLFASRAVHVSSYDKNIEDQVRPAIVPDNVIDVNSDKYWGPNPKTGVFGPSDPTTVSGPIDQAADGTSVLDQKVWFRPAEDLEKPIVN